MNQISLYKDQKTLVGSIKLTASKSESNRALMVKALSSESTFIQNLSNAADTQILNKCLRFIETCGVSGIPMIIDAKNAGTVYRFVTAYLAIRPGKWLLTGSERMQQRPIKELVGVLQQLNADVTYVEEDGFPPLLINGKKLSGGSIDVNSSISSQYITALLLVAPLLKDGLELNLKGRLISRPYVKMTIEIMQYFGINVDYSDRLIIVKPQEYLSNEFTVSPDWSAASYWYEMAALSDEVDLFIPELKKQSMQGDRVVPEIFEMLGVSSEFTEEGLRLRKQAIKTDYLKYDFIDCPDLAQAVIATCVGLGIEGAFKGLQSLRIKETDRIEKLNDEFQVFGYSLVEIESDLWKLIKNKNHVTFKDGHVFKTYDDHRMAMALAPLCLVSKKMTIDDPEVVKKSYPKFWNDLEMVGFQIEKI
jgi:3-phosphoshikimate 1-carboxyvinyltransferase